MKCKRVLILPGLCCIALPWFLPALQQLAWIAVFYFVGSFMMLTNFPYFSTMLHSKPVYVDDLSIQVSSNNIDTRFKTVYELIMVFFLSGLIAVFADYIYLNGINVPPLEFIGIVGGNISVYLRIQNTVGKILLKLCFCLKRREENRLTEEIPETKS